MGGQATTYLAVKQLEFAILIMLRVAHALPYGTQQNTTTCSNAVIIAARQCVTTRHLLLTTDCLYIMLASFTVTDDVIISAGWSCHGQGACRRIIHSHSS